MPTVERLKRRGDFVRAAKSGQHVGLKTMIVQCYVRTPETETSPGIRLGFTASRRVGGAVQRNRAKRRLREVTRAVLSELQTPHPMVDLVVIARAIVVDVPFQKLLTDFSTALHKLGIAK